MVLVEIPGGPDAKALRAALTHDNGEWALRNPHDAMQIHVDCRVGVCVAKTVGWGELQRQGKLVPDSGRIRR
ncbi:hypothetical protein [Nocardia sp. NBC_00511]|uniref:hypothetical protein n=1 Tax=Nocardia sp. NBC_00511 TaxID=2903591 RepID=UPI0030DE36F0